MDRLASARGDFASGRQLLAAQRFGQQEAMSEFDRQIARLGALAGAGQTAAAQQGGFQISALPQFSALGQLAVGTAGTGRRASGQALQQFGQDLGEIGAFAGGGGFGGAGAPPGVPAGGGLGSLAGGF